MRYKTELYVKEQDEIIQQIINILKLDNEYSTTLYELDNNIEKQQNILNLIPNIRKYFNYKNVIGLINPELCKRPYHSIIKFIIKKKYNLYNSDATITINNNKIRTTKYIFIEKNSI